MTKKISKAAADIIRPEWDKMQEFIKDKGQPEPGKQYALTGAPGTPCIANGNTWAESEVGGAPRLQSKIAALCDGKHASIDDIINCKSCAEALDSMN